MPEYDYEDEVRRYRMIIIPAVEATDREVEFWFETAAEMMSAKNVAADLLLFLQDIAEVMKDYSNLFFLEEFVDGEWQEYEEEL